MSVTQVNSHVLIPDPADWSEAVDWSRTWEVAESESIEGGRKAAALRQVPRIGLEWSVTEPDPLRNEQLKARLRAALESGKACAPYHGRGSVLSANVTADEATLGDSHWPWAADDYLILHNGDLDNPVWETAQVDSVASNVLTLTGSVTNTSAFLSGMMVWPLVFGRLEVGSFALESDYFGKVPLTLTERVGAFSAQAVSPTNYASRPVLTDAVDWSRSPSQRFSYDVRDLDVIGFGAEHLQRLQTYAVHGFDFELFLTTDAEIAALDDWLAALKGRLTGFWLPGPDSLGVVKAGVSGTVFDLEDSGLRDTYGDHPAIHLEVIDGASTGRAAISSIALNSGDERVTLGTSLGFTPSAGALVRRLYYVRQASDRERGTFPVEGMMRRRMSVIELPLEYTTAETGTSPVWLYTFTRGSQTWRYTSFAADLESNSNTFTAVPMTHGAIAEGIHGGADRLEIEAAYLSGAPWVFGTPFPGEDALSVAIHEATYGDPDTTTAVWAGRVSQARRRGDAFALECRRIIDGSRSRLPGVQVGPLCAYQIYSTPCGVSQGSFEVTGGNLDSISDREIEVSHSTDFGQAADHFSLGWVELGSGATFERRAILKDVATSGTVRTLTLDMPLQHASVNDSVTVIPGCAGRWPTDCSTKFSNTNFSGHPFVPEKNPTIEAAQTPQAQGGKK